MDYPIQLIEQAGQHLRALRKRLGLSQEALGRRLGVSQGRVAQIENGTGTVSFEQILRCVQAVGAELLIRESPQADVGPRSRASPKSRRRTTPTAAAEQPAIAVAATAVQDIPHADEAGPAVRTPAVESILHAPHNRGSW